MAFDAVTIATAAHVASWFSATGAAERRPPGSMLDPAGLLWVFHRPGNVLLRKVRRRVDSRT